LRGGIEIGAEHLHLAPLGALRLVDRDRRAVQEDRAHGGGGDDRRFVLLGCLDLDDRGDAHPRVLGADHMDPRESRAGAGAEVDHLSALDEAARLEIHPALAVLQGQLDPVADQRFAGQQRVEGRGIGEAEGVDQPDARGIAPDQHRGSRHGGSVDPGCQDHALVATGSLAEHILEIAEGEGRVGERVGEVEDRVVGGLPVDAVKDEVRVLGQAVEDHGTGGADRRELRRIPEKDERAEEFTQIGIEPVVEHRGFVDEADVERLIPALPALDEVGPAQSRGRQRAGDRRRRLIEGVRPVKGGLGQTLDLRPVALAGQPFGNCLVLGIVERRVEDAVDRRRGHAARAQHARGLVGGREHGQRALLPRLAALVVSGDRLDARGDQPAHQLREQHRLARPGLADHRERRLRPAALGQQRRAGQIDARRHERRFDPGIGPRLVFGELHAASLAAGVILRQYQQAAFRRLPGEPACRRRWPTVTAPISTA
jgi:hypothetical protein